MKHLFSFLQDYHIKHTFLTPFSSEIIGVSRQCLDVYAISRHAFMCLDNVSICRQGPVNVHVSRYI